MSFKILTVDDSRMARMVVAKAFAPYDCEVFEASNGMQGLAVASDIVPDLIFLDITMADMNGLAMLESLRQVPALANTPVVMVTAESGNSSLKRAEELKVAGYVAKPFKGEQLVAIATPLLSLQPAVAS
jgi:CheY-like chemotaxis protein